MLRVGTVDFDTAGTDDSSSASSASRTPPTSSRAVDKAQRAAARSGHDELGDAPPRLRDEPPAPFDQGR